jgi:hypothetical protein
MLGRARAQFPQIVRRPVDAAQRGGGDVRAHQHQIGAKLFHHVEFAFGAVEGARALRLGQALEIAEGLEQGNLQPMIAHHAAHFARASVEGQEVVLENLDAVEPRRRDGRQLLTQIATDRNGRNRGLH